MISLDIGVFLQPARFFTLLEYLWLLYLTNTTRYFSHRAYAAPLAQPLSFCPVCFPSPFRLYGDDESNTYQHCPSSKSGSMARVRRPRPSPW